MKQWPVIKWSFWVSTFLLMGAQGVGAKSLPAQPKDAGHPGSGVYKYSVRAESFKALGRNVDVFLPAEAEAQGVRVPVVIFGHGQSLDLSVYRLSFEHLAKKGIAVIFPTFDTGFFDQDWRRMASDYSAMSRAALDRFKVMDASQVVYSGHSKGAYVASVAAGLPVGSQTLPPASILLFNPAGFDSAWLKNIDGQIPATVIWSEDDSIVKEQVSLDLMRGLPSQRKQYIRVRGYKGTSPELKADHFFTLTKSTFFGGSDGPTPLHWYASWKWLVAAAKDLAAGARSDDPYLYGAEAASSGLEGLHHDIQRSWVQSTDPLESVLDQRVVLQDIGEVAFRGPIPGNVGPAVVLVQGVFGGTTHRHLRELRSELDQKGARVWTMDLPGTGESASPKRITDQAVLQKFLEVFIQVVVKEPVILAAEQVMGIAALHVAKTKPQLFQKLVVMAPTGIRYLAQPALPGQEALFNKYWNDEPAAIQFYQELVSEKSARFYLGKAYFNPAAVTDDRIREITLTAQFVDQTWASLCFVGGQIFGSFADAAAGVSIPVSVVIGEAPSAPVTNGLPETVDLFQAVAPQFRYVVVPEAANLPHREHPALVAAEILR